ncbi:two-component system, chemotaxis family, response regulator CheY [Allopseudospirillum japonicum]|uniref:Two-component system, chemotaxis family, response regulator CheY n=1 Tax=Allopseudospirillum japonicum TaxID=64971 RepID=A0A1H6T8X0_9GAMM|nr:response regulator [Allopseudospirillum japonicum]SEI76488.1 two-component system, chemotaxis family, response regulator CheY [Allopseudospirillum japonicum]
MEHLSIYELSILLVEPSPTQRRIIEQHLKDEGILGIETAADARSAFNKMRTYTPDLVISSLYLPDAQAGDLVALMQSDPRLEHIPFMVISSERKWENLEAIRQSKVLALLPKPFNHQDLQRALIASLDYIVADELNLDLYDIKQLRVLVVDDSRLARKHLCRVLNQLGVEQLVEAKDGKDALHKLSADNFDLIVTDYNMPEMDGRELTEYVRTASEHSHVPILMVTSENDQARLSSVQQAGVSAICDKPFEVNNVRYLLTQLLEPEVA